jgi:hypothetical protein
MSLRPTRSASEASSRAAGASSMDRRVPGGICVVNQVCFGERSRGTPSPCALPRSLFLGGLFSSSFVFGSGFSRNPFRQRDLQRRDLRRSVEESTVAVSTVEECAVARNSDLRGGSIPWTAGFSRADGFARAQFSRTALFLRERTCVGEPSLPPRSRGGPATVKTNGEAQLRSHLCEAHLCKEMA